MMIIISWNTSFPKFGCSCSMYSNTGQQFMWLYLWYRFCWRTFWISLFSFSNDTLLLVPLLCFNLCPINYLHIPHGVMICRPDATNSPFFFLPVQRVQSSSVPPSFLRLLYSHSHSSPAEYFRHYTHSIWYIRYSEIF